MKNQFIKILVAGNCMFWGLGLLYAQSLKINSGTVTTLDNTFVILNGTSLHVDGEYNGQGQSVTQLKGDYEQRIEGTGDIILNDLIVKSDIDLTTNIIVNGELNFVSGLVNINNSYTYLNGSISNENEFSRIYSNDIGKIITYADLESGIANPLNNLGLTVTANTDYASVLFGRGHEILNSGDSYGVARYFTLPDLSSPLEITFQLLEGELNGLEKSSMELNAFSDNRWQTVQTIAANNNSNFFKATIPASTTLITLFERIPIEGVVVSGGISPNNDSFNDKFIIGNVENYPNNKLIIINRWGDVLIERVNYQNDWGGENENGVGVANNTILPDGTYFYIFFKDVNDPDSVIKGSFEIRSGN